MSDSPTFGAWLQQWRKHHDLTQVELARQVGCAPGTLRNIEAGVARPSKQLAARLAQALGVANADIDAMVAFARSQPATPAPAPTNAAPAIKKTVAAFPTPLSRMIGRAGDIAAVCAMLRRDDVHLVSVTGAGGSGKTRVALRIAEELRASFADGMAFVDLAAISDPDLVLSAVAQALGMPTQSAFLEQQLAQMLAGRRMLLLLDNFEQVVSAAPEIARLLQTYTTLKVLVTSRTRLDVSGEHEYPLQPLALPDLAQKQPPAAIGQFDAVRLFLERAQAVNPQFVLNAGNAHIIAQICQRLDGLPLAIELAAAWVKLFDAPGLYERLERRLPLLGGGYDRPARQQTMRATIEWSYQLLSPELQRLFQRVGVFAGGATFAAIEAVSASDTESVLAGVSALVDHNLVRVLPPGANHEPRFGMFETIREYALEQLAQQPNARATLRLHARYFSELATKAMLEWEGPHAEYATARLDQEYDNIRSVLHWALANDTLLGQRLAATICRFWRSHGHIGEGRAWLDQLLAFALSGDDPEYLEARQLALHAAAWLASDQHDYSQAVRLFGQSMALRSALGETISDTHLLNTAALQARARGEYPRAVALLEQALGHYQQIGQQGTLSSGGYGFALYFLGLMYRELGDFPRAADLFTRCIAFHKSIGDREGMAQGMLGMADMARDMGEAAVLWQRSRECEAIFRELGVQWALGFVLNNNALAALLDANADMAQHLVNESLALFRSLQADASRGEVLLTAGAIALARREYIVAGTCFAESIQLTEHVGPRLILVMALEGMAAVHLAQGQFEASAHLLAIASSQRRAMGTPARPADRPLLETTSANARRALGHSRYEAIRAAVAALPFEEALDALPIYKTSLAYIQHTSDTVFGREEL